MTETGSKTGHRYLGTTIHGRGHHLGDHLGDTINNFYGHSTVNASHLKGATAAVFTSRHHEQEPFCLQGTHQDVLQDIYAWAYNAESLPVFWLRGMPGTGKSTIARTAAWSIAGDLHTKRRPVATWAFSRRPTSDPTDGERDAESEDSPDVDDAQYLFDVLALQLMSYEPLEPYISQSLRRSQHFPEMGLRQRWENFVIEPLKAAHEAEVLNQPACFVIDGLDQCKKAAQISTILNVLETASVGLHRLARFLITSRPERLIFDKLGDAQFATSFNLDQRSRAIVRADLSEICSNELPNLETEAIDELTYAADTSFSFMKRACVSLKSRAGSAVENRKYIITAFRWTKDRTDDPPDAVFNYRELYHRWFETVSPRYQQTWKDNFAKYINGMSVMFGPLPFESFTTLMALAFATESHVVSNFMLDVQSAVAISMDVKAPLRFIHSSFKRHLWAKMSRSESAPLHSALMRGCIELIRTKGQRELACLDKEARARQWIENDSGHGQPARRFDELITLNMSPECQYAFRYWLLHLEESYDSFIRVVEGKFQKYLIDYCRALLYLEGWIGCYRAMQCLDHHLTEFKRQAHSPAEDMWALKQGVFLLLEALQYNQKVLDDRPWHFPDIWHGILEDLGLFLN
ncbi:uncharacterized protein EI97DRAFT_431817 [Westerdykella ornata]|uniref:Nephrocystin 3-like N-terminal domain-containing protein n=1 Tax=Westerdykella ornata TaxID=318751 RepID=A0A6A6JMB4_WESOR|nr:uncharacterized protein EI97DRAFT_431817 [Westerdykella ornata]KAF2277731.1 hypothetical protein EI97DRAFT_431817 [Westerdykella ornata]